VDIEKAAGSSTNETFLSATFVKLVARIPIDEPASMALVDANWIKMIDLSKVALTFAYGFAGIGRHTNIAVEKEDGRTAFLGLSVVSQPTSHELQSNLGLRGKTPVQYFVLVFTIILPLLTLYALAVCLRAKLTGRKWPWALFIVFGYGKLAVNWFTGEWAFVPLSLQLFSASAFAPPYGPWTFAISFPLGAVIFLLLAKKLSAPKVLKRRKLQIV
jgi:hypothetical protein